MGYADRCVQVFRRRGRNELLAYYLQIGWKQCNKDRAWLGGARLAMKSAPSMRMLWAILRRMPTRRQILPRGPTADRHTKVISLQCGAGTVIDAHHGVTGAFQFTCHSDRRIQ